MVYELIADPNERREFNWHPHLRDWVRVTDIYSPDCPACLRGRDHTVIQHELQVLRVLEASRA